MSASSLYMVFQKSAREIKEYANGWGTGPAIWDYMVKEYLGYEGSALMLGGFGSDDGLRPLWDLAVDEKVPELDRFVLGFTFDMVFCPPDTLGVLGDACRQVGGKIGAMFPERVNHFPQIGEDILTVDLDHRAAGIALTCTSVSDQWSGWNGDRAISDINDVIRTNR